MIARHPLQTLHRDVVLELLRSVVEVGAVLFAILILLPAAVSAAGG